MRWLRIYHRYHTVGSVDQGEATTIETRDSENV
jgi:hypothetical protein